MDRQPLLPLMASLACAGLLAAADATFQEDLDFLRGARIEVVTLAAGDARVAISPAWQARVLTSTATGPGGRSLGWINRELIAARRILPHMNAFGGEDRFWLGPEGGQFSIFFAAGAPFDLEHWQTPPAIDTEPFETVAVEPARASFRRSCRLANYAGTVFDLGIEREVRLLDGAACARHLGLAIPAGVQAVAFESDNRLTNRGTAAWTKAGGLLSIWILGMFPPSPSATVVIPLAGSASPVVDDYFGKVPADRLVIRGGAAFFRADGRYRSKIGIPPGSCRPVMGSWDEANRVLTIVQFSFDPARTDYVNSQWAIQARPFAGDVANSYNDGPPAPGAKPLGPFYELESSSPAVELAPGATLAHVHRTLHCTGDRAALDGIARTVLGVTLDDIRAALP